MIFANRLQAGQELGAHLQKYANRDDVIVLGAARGGVPVASEVARLLRVPLDVFVLRKLGVPRRKELAFGAIASGGVRVLDTYIIDSVGVTPGEIDNVTRAEEEELKRRECEYRAGRPPLQVAGLTVILVDDGIATGSSMRAAVQALRQMRPAEVVLATPVAPAATCARLRPEVDELVCLSTPVPFYGVGQFYEDFSEVSDAEVQELLRRARQGYSEGDHDRETVQNGVGQ